VLGQPVALICLGSMLCCPIDAFPLHFDRVFSDLLHHHSVIVSFVMLDDVDVCLSHSAICMTVTLVRFSPSNSQC